MEEQAPFIYRSFSSDGTSSKPVLIPSPRLLSIPPATILSPWLGGREAAICNADGGDPSRSASVCAQVRPLSSRPPSTATLTGSKVQLTHLLFAALIHPL